MCHSRIRSVREGIYTGRSLQLACLTTNMAPTSDEIFPEKMSHCSERQGQVHKASSRSIRLHSPEFTHRRRLRLGSALSVDYLPPVGWRTLRPVRIHRTTSSDRKANIASFTYTQRINRKCYRLAQCTSLWLSD